MRKAKPWILAIGAMTLVFVVVGGLFHNPARALPSTEDEAVVRTRDQVKMLDTLYKNAVVATTDIYKKGPPAIMMGKRVFEAMEKEGWHSVRLVDVTGSPLNDANLAKTDFEKRAEGEIKTGKAYYEEVVEENGKKRLLAATVVPAVHARCAACHGVEEGELLGFIRYDVPVK